MLVGAASFQHTPSVPLSRSKVCIRKLSPSCNFKVSLCSFIGVEVENPFARFAYKTPFLSRAEFLTHRRQAQSTPSSQKFQGERSFQKGTQRLDLQSLKEALQHDALHSYNDSPSQDLQRLTEAQPNRDVGLEQQRPPKAESVQDYPARSQLADAQSSAASSGSPRPGSLNRNRKARPSKHRGSRIPARGLDALDKLIAIQGRSSRALLESLQSTVASDDDGIPHKHSNEKDLHASASFSGNVSRNETAEGTRGSMSQMLSNFRKIDAWKPTYDATADDVATSSTFASSIEKALSPSTAPKASRSTLASFTNGRVLEQNTSTSREAYSSDVAKPSLQGQEVLLALQKAAIEKAKLKQRNRKVSVRPSKSKEVALPDLGEWRDAKPIVVKPEWAHQIDELERRIENLKNPMPSS